MSVDIRKTAEDVVEVVRSVLRGDTSLHAPETQEWAMRVSLGFGSAEDTSDPLTLAVIDCLVDILMSDDCGLEIPMSSFQKHRDVLERALREA